MRSLRSGSKSYFRRTFSALEQRAFDLAAKVDAELVRQDNEYPLTESFKEAIQKTFDFVLEKLEEVKLAKEDLELLREEAEAHRATASEKHEENRGLRNRIAELQQEAEESPVSSDGEAYESQIRELQDQLQVTQQRLTAARKRLAFEKAPRGRSIGTMTQVVTEGASGARNILASLHSIPDFTGTDTAYPFSEFKETLDSYSKIGGWTDIDKFEVAKVKMSGKAKKIFRLKNPKDWKELVSTFENHISNSVPVANMMLAFVSCRQKVGETVDEFAHRLERYYEGALPREGDEDRDKVKNWYKRLQRHIFIAGLAQGELKSHVELKDPKTYDEALKAAQEKESLAQLRGLVLNQNSELDLFAGEQTAQSQSLVCDPMAVKLEKIVAKLELITVENTKTRKLAEKAMQRRNDNRSPSKNQPRSRSTSSHRGGRRACFICRRTNHIARDCFFKDKKRDSSKDKKEEKSKEQKYSKRNNYKKENVGAVYFSDSEGSSSSESSESKKNLN